MLKISTIETSQHVCFSIDSDSWCSEYIGIDWLYVLNKYIIRKPFNIGEALKKE